MGPCDIRKPHQTESLAVESQNSPDRQHPYIGLGMLGFYDTHLL